MMVESYIKNTIYILIENVLKAKNYFMPAIEQIILHFHISAKRFTANSMILSILFKHSP
jgi:hypothetical protein